VLVVAQLLPPPKLHNIVVGQLPPQQSRLNMHHNLDQQLAEVLVLDLMVVAQCNIQQDACSWLTSSFGCHILPLPDKLKFTPDLFQLLYFLSKLQCRGFTNLEE
jgi:hypothetical protein